MMKKYSVLTAAVMLAASLAAGSAAAAETDEFLASLEGSYVELFPVMADEANDGIWQEAIGAYTDDEDTYNMYYSMFTDMFMSDLYGEEAVEAYGDGSEGYAFNCFFQYDVTEFTFEGNTISGADADGNELFSHSYHYVEDIPVSYYGQDLGTSLHLYESDDADSGDFTYFAFTDDVPAETYHLEFRYGASAEDMGSYTEGAYAYWLASAISADYDEGLCDDVITLFVDENLGEEAEDAEAVTEDQEADTEDVNSEAADTDVIEIDSAEALAAVSENLSGSYVLTADIDLSGAEWIPLGAFEMPEEAASEEEMVVPNDKIAFTGTFDGAGHTISNFVINQPENFALGLFGCISNADVGNFTIENATVDGSFMFAAAVGYTYCSNVHDITVNGAVLNAHATDISEEGMYGAVAGAGLMSVISGCAADAELNIPDGTGNIGIVAGGMEMTSLIDCTASGTINAGDNCYGIGGVSGCGFGSEEFTGCTAQNVTVNAGANTRWIGGVTGYAGGYEDEAYGVPVTVFTGCSAENVTFELGEGSEEAGAVVGSGFYSEEAAAMGAPYDAPTVFVIN